MSKFLYFSLFICPILFIISLLTSLVISEQSFMSIGLKGWLAILAMLLFNGVFLFLFLVYKKARQLADKKEDNIEMPDEQE